MSASAFRPYAAPTSTATAVIPDDHDNDADLARHSIDALDAAICTLARGLNAKTYRLLVLVRAFDDRMGWAKWSFRNCAEWLAWRCGLSLSAAREKVRTAQALRELPAISSAFESGRLSYSKVRALTRVVEWHSESALLAFALDATAAQVEDRCREIRNANPDSSNGIARRAWDRRTLTLWRDAARGVMFIRVEVPLEDGEIIAQALERAVAANETASGIEFGSGGGSGAGSARVRAHAGADGSAEADANGWRAQQADALVAVAKAYLGAVPSAEGDDCCTGECGGGRPGEDVATRSSEPAYTSTADRYQVVVHVTDEALRGGQGRADLPIATLRRLTCDGSVVTVREDERGTPLDVGRKQRTVPTALKRALWSRDRRCSFPGCDRTRYIDAHHIRHWADGGDTSLANLTLLCSHHHRLLHEGGYSIRRDERGALFFRRADGRVIPRGGYCADDMCDDVIDGAASYEWSGSSSGSSSAEGLAQPTMSDHTSAEGFARSAASLATAREVRETRGVYRHAGRIRRCSTAASCC